jgi:hypothetical protein
LNADLTKGGGPDAALISSEENKRSFPTAVALTEFINLFSMR